MTEEYRQLTDGQKMLRYFYEELEAAFERGEPDLILQISRIAGDTDMYIRPVTTGGLKNVAEELGLDSGARALSACSEDWITEDTCASTTAAVAPT